MTAAHAAPLDLANARMKLARDLLLAGALTADELGFALGVQPDSATRIIRELRESGLPVQEWGWDRYHIVYPAGRVCTHVGCGTVLRISNPSDRCTVHGGGDYSDG